MELINDGGWLVGWLGPHLISVHTYTATTEDLGCFCFFSSLLKEQTYLVPWRPI